MNELAWTDSLDAPRSIATRGNTAVAVIEDPGVIEIHLAINDLYLQRRCNKILGAELPMDPWNTVVIDDMRIVWVRPWRWQIILPRDRVGALIDAFSGEIETNVLSNLTGAYACFRIVGEAAGEILVRVTPTDLGAIDPGSARGTSIAHVHALLVCEQNLPDSWLVFAPRSYAEHVASALVEAARTPGRLGVFEPATAPLV